MEINAIVAGAGIWGCTIARRLAESGKKVLVLERRAAIGGNVRCEDRDGIEVHSYGSHIFHTHIPEVWNFIQRFTDFNGYQHKVLASYKGKAYFLPIGLTLINKFFGVELKPGEVSNFMKDEAHSRAVFNAFFRGYTSKQWGRSPEDISPSIIKRVPVRNNYDVNYFNDYWQGIPSDGYNKLFERMLEHPNIEVRCNTVFSLNTLNEIGLPLPHVVYYSGPIDALFNYKFGELPWRSLRFEVEELNVIDYQGTSVMNYPEVEVPYTRIHEFKHYHPERSEVMSAPKTVIMYEYPKQWEKGDEPYYPIDNVDSQALVARYMEEVERINHASITSGSGMRLIVGGRLGQYKYYDMDRSIEAALNVEI